MMIVIVCIWYKIIYIDTLICTSYGLWLQKNGTAKEAYSPGYFSDHSKGLGVHTSSEAVLSVGEAKTCGFWLGMMVGGWVIHETKHGTLNMGLKTCSHGCNFWFPLISMVVRDAFKQGIQGIGSRYAESRNKTVTPVRSGLGPKGQKKLPKNSRDHWITVFPRVFFGGIRLGSELCRNGQPHDCLQRSLCRQWQQRGDFLSDRVIAKISQWAEFLGILHWWR